MKHEVSIYEQMQANQDNRFIGICTCGWECCGWRHLIEEAATEHVHGTMPYHRVLRLVVK
jgi:hypothetical protein